MYGLISLKRRKFIEFTIESPIESSASEFLYKLGNVVKIDGCLYKVVGFDSYATAMIGMGQHVCLKVEEV